MSEEQRRSEAAREVLGSTADDDGTEGGKRRWGGGGEERPALGGSCADGPCGSRGSSIERERLMRTECYRDLLVRSWVLYPNSTAVSELLIPSPSHFTLLRSTSRVLSDPSPGLCRAARHGAEFHAISPEDMSLKSPPEVPCTSVAVAAGLSGSVVSFSICTRLLLSQGALWRIACSVMSCTLC